MGFDLVGYSGGKGLRGPQAAGLLLGRKDLIEAARLNSNPNGDTLCRTNKVNKEEIIGMLVAPESYVKQDHAKSWKEWEERCPLHHEGAGDVQGRTDRDLHSPGRQRGTAPPCDLGRRDAKAGRDQDGSDAPRRRAQHRSRPRLATAVANRRLDDGAR